MRDYLRLEAEKNVVAECGRQFKSMLMVGEYRGRVMAVNYEEETGKMHLAILDA